MQQTFILQTPLGPPVPAQQLTDVAQSLFHKVSVQGSIPANPPRHDSAETPPGSEQMFTPPNLQPFTNQIVASCQTPIDHSSRQREKRF